MHEGSVSLEESLENVAQQRDFWISQLPCSLTPEELQGFRDRLIELYGRFENNIRTIYKKGMSLGKGFSGLLCHAHEDDYLFYLEGVARHFEDGAAQVGWANNVVSTNIKGERELFEYQAILATKIRIGFCE